MRGKAMAMGFCSRIHCLRGGIATLALLFLSASGVAYGVTPKSCDYTGGSSCPSAAPIISPWVYMPYYSSSPGLNSLDEFAAQMIQNYTTPPNTWCTLNLTSTTDDGSKGSDYGIDVSHEWTLQFSGTVATNSTPPCG